MAAHDPEYTERARADLESLGKLAARSVVVWLRQWARGDRDAEVVPLHHEDPDKRYVRLDGGLAAAFRMMRPHELARTGRSVNAPLIVRVLPERELTERRREILDAMEQADDDA